KRIKDCLGLHSLRISFSFQLSVRPRRLVVLNEDEAGYVVELVGDRCLRCLKWRLKQKRTAQVERADDAHVLFGDSVVLQEVSADLGLLGKAGRRGQAAEDGHPLAVAWQGPVFQKLQQRSCLVRTALAGTGFLGETLTTPRERGRSHGGF